MSDSLSSSSSIHQQKFIFFVFAILVLRSIVWKILLDYVPTNKLNVDKVLSEKRAEYQYLINQYLSTLEEFDESENKYLKVIKTDVPRTQSDIELFRS